MNFSLHGLATTYIFSWLVIGGLLALAFIFMVRLLKKWQAGLFSCALLIAVLIYVGFALWEGNGQWFIIEAAGILVYGIFILLAYRYSLLWLAVGWGLHPMWDIMLHLLGPGSSIAPPAYALACLSFDLVVAYYLYGSFKGRYKID